MSLLSILLILLILQEFLRKFLNIFFLKYIDEFVLLIIFLLLITRIKKYRLLQKEVFIFYICYIGFIITGIFSSLINKYTILATILQMLLDLKFLFIFSFFYIFYFKYKTKCLYISCKPKLVEAILHIIIIISLPLSIWALCSPETYHQIFKYSGDFGLFLFDIPRASGIFWFTGTLASFSAMILGILLLEKQKNFFLIIISFSLLILTFSRQEIFAFIVSLILTKNFFQKNISFGIKILNVICFLCLILISLIYSFKYLVPEWHILNLTDIYFATAPRVILYLKSFILVRKFFPFGSGLGSYGSAMSVLFNSKIYHSLDFDQYGWYINGASVLTDTYWPMILGETGIIGTLLSLISYIILLKFFYKLRKCFYELAIRGFFVILYLLFVSPTAPIFNSTIILFTGFTLIFLLPFHKNTMYKTFCIEDLYYNENRIFSKK